MRRLTLAILAVTLDVSVLAAGAIKPGTYKNEEIGETFELRPDGTFLLRRTNTETEGYWRMQGDSLVLFLGFPVSVLEDGFIDPNGYRFTRANVSPGSAWASGASSLGMTMNEARAIRDLRTIFNEEAAYMEINGGYFGDLACVADPASCLPQYDSAHPLTLAAEMGKPVATRNGYVFRFQGITPVRASANVGRRSFANFVYTAVPVTPGETGQRGFATDSSGLICVTTDGSVPDMSPGKCRVLD